MIDSESLLEKKEYITYIDIMSWSIPNHVIPDTINDVLRCFSRRTVFGFGSIVETGWHSGRVRGPRGNFQRKNDVFERDQFKIVT